MRDLIIHSYYWGTSNDEFDKVTMVFASIGIAASAAAVGAIGAPVAAFAAGAKAVAKSLKGAPVATHIADDIWDAYANKGKSMDQAIERTAPLMMITAFVVLEGESLVQIKDFVVEAIDDQEDFEAWVNYTQAFFEKAAKSTALTAQNIPREILNVLIPLAYAGIADELRTKEVRAIVKLMEEVTDGKLIGKVTQGYRLPKEFTKAIKAINKTPDAELKDLLTGANSAAMRGILLVGHVAGEDGLRRVMNFQGVKNLSYDQLLTSMARLNDLPDVVDASKLDEVMQGLAKVFRQFQAGEGVKAFNKSHGAANEVYELARRIDLGQTITGIQNSSGPINTAIGGPLGKRIYDFQAEVAGSVVNFDKKAWSYNSWQTLSRQSLNWKGGSIGDATSQTGQLYKDIVQSYPDKFGSIRWVFDQRMLDHFGGDLVALKQGLSKDVMVIFDNSSELKRKMMRDLGYDFRLGIDELEDQFDRDVLVNLPSLFEVTTEG